MGFLTPYLLWIKAGVVVALIAGLFAFGYSKGSNHVQAKWDHAKAVQLIADNSALLKRNTDNAALRTTQTETNRILTKAHDNEIDQVRADLAHSDRLRIGSAICPNVTRQTITASTIRSDATDTASGVLSPEMDAAIKSLILETEQVAATGRAAQTFIKANGLSP